MRVRENYCQRRIAVFTGTRAEYGLLYWLMRDIQSSKDLELKLLVSGSHYSPEFGLTYKKIIEDGFFIDEKVEMLLSSDSAIGVVKSMGVALLGFGESLERIAPDVLIILGDRFEALAVAQTALILRIPILHIHGGEITEGAYDDAIRHSISKFSYLHATSTNEYRKRVIQLGESPDRVVNVGAIGLDHVQRTSLLTLRELSKSLEFNLNKPYFLVTYHPVTVADEPAVESFCALIEALDCFSKYQVIITYPNSDDGGRSIIPHIEDYAARNLGRVLSIPSLGQLRYLSAVKYCQAVIGNSSSGIIEVPSFFKPTVNIGLRQKGRICADSIIQSTPTKEGIVAGIASALKLSNSDSLNKCVNPYGQGGASKKIIGLLRGKIFQSQKSFYDVEFKT